MKFVLKWNVKSSVSYTVFFKWLVQSCILLVDPGYLLAYL